MTTINEIINDIERFVKAGNYEMFYVEAKEFKDKKKVKVKVKVPIEGNRTLCLCSFTASYKYFIMFYRKLDRRFSKQYRREVWCFVKENHTFYKYYRKET